MHNGYKQKKKKKQPLSIKIHKYSVADIIINRIQLESLLTKQKLGKLMYPYDIFLLTNGDSSKQNKLK